MSRSASAKEGYTVNARPFACFAFTFLRVLLTSVLLLGLGPLAQRA